MASADRELSRIIKQAYLKRHKTSNLYAFIWPRNTKAARERNREKDRWREGGGDKESDYEGECEVAINAARGQFGKRSEHAAAVQGSFEIQIL